MFVGNFLLCHSSADICEKSSGCVPHSKYFTMWILSCKCELLFGENTMTKSFWNGEKKLPVLSLMLKLYAIKSF